MKSYQEFLTEIKTPSSFDQKEHMKMLKNFKSDLRKLNKIYKDIKPEIVGKGYLQNYSIKSEKRFLEAKKIFQVYSKNFEEWVYDTLLNSKIIGTSEEPSDHENVRKTVWPCVHIFNQGFPEVYVGSRDDRPEYGPDMHTVDKKMDTFIRNWNAAFNKAFKVLEDYIKNNDVSSSFPTWEDVTIKGVLVRIQGKGRTESNEKSIKQYIQKVVPEVIKLYTSKGLKISLRQLTIILSMDSSSANAGEYNFDKSVTILPWGFMGSIKESVFVLTHEIAHRFYYEVLKKDARKLWDEIIINSKINITPSHINSFVDLFDENGNLLKTAKRTIENAKDPQEYAAFSYLSQVVSFKHTTKERIIKRAKSHEGVNTHKEFITEYAGKNASEAFAEALALYLTKGPRRLGPWTREFLKRIINTTGITLKEDTLKSYKDISTDKRII